MGAPTPRVNRSASLARNFSSYHRKLSSVVPLARNLRRARWFIFLTLAERSAGGRGDVANTQRRHSSHGAEAWRRLRLGQLLRLLPSGTCLFQSRSSGSRGSCVCLYVCFFLSGVRSRAPLRWSS